MLDSIDTNRSVGTLLRETREANGLTLRDLAAVTRIQSSMLLCLEEDRWEEFPAEVFARGFLRSYARELGLDENNVLDMYHEQTDSHPERVVVEPQAPLVQRQASSFAEPGRLARLAYVGAIAALILGLVVSVLVFGARNDDASAAIVDDASFSTDGWTNPAPGANDWRTYRNN